MGNRKRSSKTAVSAPTVDQTTLETVGKLADAMNSMAGHISEFKEIAGVIRAESLYLMHASQRDRVSKEMLPHYSWLLGMLKNAGVFTLNDMYKSNIDAINNSFAALDVRSSEMEKSMANLKAEISALQEDVKTIRGGGKWYSFWNRKGTAAKRRR